MRAPRALRRLGVATATGAVVLGVIPAVPASAASVPAGAPEVRMVIRTSTGAAGADVADVVERHGARPAGRVKQLRAVALDVPMSSVEAVRRTLLRRTDVMSVDVAHRRWLTEEPIDPRFAEQRTYLDAVRATTAWSRPAHGAPSVRIAVVDSGADVSHPDLAGKVAGTFNAVTRGTDVTDLIGHGTGVSSVAAAATNNGEGISGAGYDSTLLVAKVADRTGRIFTDDLAAGIVWAADSGADVINLSLGGPASDRLERDAVRYAQARGVLVVAAAGNDGTTARQYPATLPDVLSVGATSANGATRAAFSSFGGWVDVGAPGRDLLVATPGGGYELVDGTSFSAPLVAGEVALLEAYRPGRTAAELAAAVINGANTAKLGFARGLVDFDASLDLLPPAGVPTITAPGDGSTVGGVTTVTVASSAAKVRLTFADLSQLVPVQGGVASASFETYGLAGAHPVTATDCSRIDQCSATSSGVTSTVSNAAPVLTAPAQGSDAYADTVTATADAPGGAVRFLLDGVSAATDTAAPFQAELSTERLTDGTHTVSAVLCRSDGSVCDTTTSSSVTVSVRRLHPELRGVSRSLLSPGRDGRHDTTVLTYRLRSRASVALEVRGPAGKVVLRRPLGVQPAGTHTTSWNGRSDSGSFVASGVYRVGISTRQPDGPLVGLASAAIRVDRVQPSVSGISREFGTVFPSPDDYRDTVRVAGRASEALGWVRVRARSSGGSVYTSAKTGARSPGPLGVRWDGRTPAGTTLPSGTYRVRLQAQDLAGNRAVSAAVSVTVSGQQLVRRVGSRTVTARGSLREIFADECSLVFRHTEGPRRGWIGYYSSGTCTSGDAYAVGDHQVRLPRAARYGTVQVSAFGSRGDPKYRDSALLTYYDRYQNPSRHKVRLGPRTDTYIGPRADASNLLVRNRVLRWSTMTTGLKWYDVERYTVRYTYFVLR